MTEISSFPFSLQSASWQGISTELDATTDGGLEERSQGYARGRGAVRIDFRSRIENSLSSTRPRRRCDYPTASGYFSTLYSDSPSPSNRFIEYKRTFYQIHWSRFPTA